MTAGQSVKQLGQTTASSSQKAQDDQPQPRKPSKILRVLPSRILPFDLALPEVSTDLNVAFVAYSSLLGLPDLPRNAHATSCWRVSIRRLRPPADPTQETANGATSPPTPAPRVLVPNGENTPSNDPASGTAEIKDEAILVCSPHVPIAQGHILLQGGLDGVEDWALVR